MPVHIAEQKIVPGIYAARRASAAELAEQMIFEWEQRRQTAKEKETATGIPPCICFSRKIGVGALEIAEVAGERLGLKVVDREILEHIAGEAALSEKTVSLFDERYPGRLAEFLSLAFGEKAFIRSDYTRHLFSAVFSIAGLGSTIFVGRGTHLLLPREKVLAVRLLSSREYRVNRLASMLGVEKESAAERLEHLDREQAEFFRRVYGLKDASPYEFDLVINRDHIRDPGWAADIIALAFGRKFAEEVRK